MARRAINPSPYLSLTFRSGQSTRFHDGLPVRHQRVFRPLPGLVGRTMWTSGAQVLTATHRLLQMTRIIFCDSERVSGALWAARSAATTTLSAYPATRLAAAWTKDYLRITKPTSPWRKRVASASSTLRIGPRLFAERRNLRGRSKG